MTYYVDTGSGFFEVFDETERDLALECAERALESAREFHKRMGFVPFWGKRVEIRRGKSIQGLTRTFGEARNQAIIAGTKVYRVLSVEVQP